jgi:hypothetical protein
MVLKANKNFQSIPQTRKSFFFITLTHWPAVERSENDEPELQNGLLAKVVQHPYSKDAFGDLTDVS